MQEELLTSVAQIKRSFALTWILLLCAFYEVVFVKLQYRQRVDLADLVAG
jgi:hypothetical protein